MVHHVYTGVRKGEKGIAQVFKDGQPFYHYESLEVCNHSPTGFEWGYGGSGPCQLALALLLEVTDEETAAELQHAFKWEVVAMLDRNHWRLPTRFIAQWVCEHVIEPAEWKQSARE